MQESLIKTSKRDTDADADTISSSSVYCSTKPTHLNIINKPQKIQHFPEHKTPYNTMLYLPITIPANSSIFKHKPDLSSFNLLYKSTNLPQEFIFFRI